MCSNIPIGLTGQYFGSSYYVLTTKRLAYIYPTLKSQQSCRLRRMKEEKLLHQVLLDLLSSRMSILEIEWYYNRGWKEEQTMDGYAEAFYTTGQTQIDPGYKVHTCLALLYTC